MFPLFAFRQLIERAIPGQSPFGESDEWFLTNLTNHRVRKSTVWMACTVWLADPRLRGSVILVKKCKGRLGIATTLVLDRFD